MRTGVCRVTQLDNPSSFFFAHPGPVEDHQRSAIAEDKSMREQEMRLRVFRFLKARMRNMIMPAAVGIGLAAGGCLAQSGAVYSSPMPSDAATDGVTVREPRIDAVYSSPMPSDAATVKRDASSNDVSVSGPEVLPSDTREAAMASDMPLTGQDVATSVDQSVDDQAPARDAVDTLADATADVFAPMDEKSDLRFPEAGVKYQGPVPPPDSGNDIGGETGPVIAKYLAPMLDAANDLGLAVRYMAPITDSGVQS
jgi:hypothetical protein